MESCSITAQWRAKYRHPHSAVSGKQFASQWRHTLQATPDAACQVCFYTPSAPLSSSTAACELLHVCPWTHMYQMPPFNGAPHLPSPSGGIFHCRRWSLTAVAGSRGWAKPAGFCAGRILNGTQAGQKSWQKPRSCFCLLDPVGLGGGKPAKLISPNWATSLY